MIHPSPISLRVLPIARMMHHDLVIRAIHRMGCGRRTNHYPCQAYGGAAYLSESTLSCMRCEFSNSKVTSYYGSAFGGVLYATSSDVTLDECTFSDSEAVSPGTIRHLYWR